MDDDATELTFFAQVDDTQLTLIDAFESTDVSIWQPSPRASTDTNRDLVPAPQGSRTTDATGVVIVSSRAPTEGEWPPPPREPAARRPGRRCAAVYSVVRGSD